jgi:ribosome-binding factor A
MVTFRIERLNREFLRIMAEILTNRLKDENFRKVILTGVDCSRDLSHARVYYIVMDGLDALIAKKALEISSGKIRGFLGKEMRIRQIPQLHFIFDDSELKARELDALIDRVIKEDRLEKE